MVLESDQKLPQKKIQSEPAFEEVEDSTKYNGMQVHDFQQNAVVQAPKKDIP